MGNGGWIVCQGGDGGQEIAITDFALQYIRCFYFFIDE